MTSPQAQPPHWVDPDEANPSAGYQLLLRLQIAHQAGNLGRVTTTLGEAGANILDIDIEDVTEGHMIRSIRLLCDSEEQAHKIVGAVDALPFVEVILASDRTFQLHRRGKIEIANKCTFAPTLSSHTSTPPAWPASRWRFMRTRTRHGR